MYEDEHLESDYEDRNGTFDSDYDMSGVRVEYDDFDNWEESDNTDTHDYQDMGDAAVNQYITDNRPLADETPTYYQNDPITHTYA